MNRETEIGYMMVQLVVAGFAKEYGIVSGYKDYGSCKYLDHLSYNFLQMIKSR